MGYRPYHYVMSAIVPCFSLADLGVLKHNKGQTIIYLSSSRIINQTYEIGEGQKCESAKSTQFGDGVGEGMGEGAAGLCINTNDIRYICDLHLLTLAVARSLKNFINIYHHAKYKSDSSKHIC